MICSPAGGDSGLHIRSSSSLLKQAPGSLKSCCTASTSAWPRKLTLWRISNHVSLAGHGGLWASGRWHTRGRRIVYCSQSPAAALLEVLVHFEIDIQALPARYRLLKLHAPDDLTVEAVTPGDLPEDWLERTDLTRAMGDRWLEAARSPLLNVPSAVVPETFNVLLNPPHQDAERVVVILVSEHALDPRLLASHISARRIPPRPRGRSPGSRSRASARQRA